MIDFKKKLKTEHKKSVVDPCELYLTLDRKSIAGPLRPAQKYILKEWFSKHKNDKDLIIKLHTGEGKTLIGLLLLQSKINAKEGPCMYICPNIYLANQVCGEAEKFGIPFCRIDENNNIPDEFNSGEKILIIHAQKVFNGKTVFGIENKYIKVSTVVLDDSHSCIDTIKDAQTIIIKRNEYADLYNKIFDLFKDVLSEQRPGSMYDIQNEDSTTFIPVPYWSWYEKEKEILNILSKANTNSCNCVKFVWPIIRDRIQNYCCYISGSEIEISPYNPNVEIFSSFSRAKNRILMSATTQDDAFFIKGLSFNPEAVKHPLLYEKQKWSGEKMIIIPSLIDVRLDTDYIASFFSSKSCKHFGIVSIVPNTARAKEYKNMGAINVDKSNIYEVIDSLKSRKYEKLVVFNNRYDGIDLPDEACRILILDSVPNFNCLSDRYEQLCRPESDIINKKIAQKIEQGLGRGVRGEKDYCAIIVIGTNLVKFMRSVNTKKYFSTQTRKQIDIGLNIAKFELEEKNNDERCIEPVKELIEQMIIRDDGWKEYYTVEMNKMKDESDETEIYNQLLEEAKIEKLYEEEDYEKAYSKMQKFLDHYIHDSYEKGWYLQKMARYMYRISAKKSIELQKAAFKANSQLLKPRLEIKYNKLAYLHENRMKRILSYFYKYKNYEEISLAIQEKLDYLSFGTEADKFEAALKDIGELLGFESQRPDLEIRKGPDNLWYGFNKQYAFFECKSEVADNRSSISKHEAGQMNNHCAWFDSVYGEDVEVSRYMIIPTKNLSYEADFSHDIRVIRRGKLEKFKRAIKDFVTELNHYCLQEITEETLQELINIHKLNLIDIKNIYSEEIYHNK